MILKEVQKIVESIIESSQYSPEVAHELEDKLYIKFIIHISETGTEEQKSMANEILKVKELKFDRWYS